MEAIKSILKREEVSLKSKQKPKLKNGWTKIRNDLITSQILTPNEKLFLIVLKLHGFNKGECFPSYKTIAKEIGFSIRTAIRCANSLKEKKFITYKKRKGKSNFYNISY